MRAKSAPKLFINYRRTVDGKLTKSSSDANRLYDKLTQRFGKQQIFLDQQSIGEGVPFPAEIKRRLEQSKVLLVLIGEDWLLARGEHGRRRLDEENDWVRQEIETCLAPALKLTIIPILETPAQKMPPKVAFPASIAELSDFQASKLRLDTLDNDFEAFAKMLADDHGFVPQKRPVRPTADPTYYLDYLQRQFGFIDIKGIQRQANDAQRRFPIDELYITLTYTRAAIDGGERSPARGAAGRQFAPEPRTKRKRSKSSLPATADLAESSHSVALTEALSHARLLVMGDPGSGKTTFLHKIACEAARRYHEPRASRAKSQSQVEAYPGLPLLIKIGPFCDFLQQETGKRGRPSAKAPTWIEHYLAAESQAHHWSLNRDHFKHWLEATKAPGTVVLLDGLDEAPDEKMRQRVQAIIQEFAAVAQSRYPAVRIVVTSRPLEMTGKIDLPGFEVARIDRLNDTAIETFLSKWCAALHPESEIVAKEHQAQLQIDLNSRPEIRRLAQTPVMLTALAVVQTNTGRMPEQRSKLYDSVIYWLNNAREAARKQRTPGMPSAEPVLRELALRMQTHERGFRKQLTRREAAQLVAHLFGPADVDESIAKAEQFLQYEQLDGGIVVERQRKLEFWHRTFQEYLAASAIADKTDANQDKLLFAKTGRIYQPEWREVMQLLGGVLHDAGNGCDRVNRLFQVILKKLGKKPSLPAVARCVGLFGEMLRDLVNDPRPDPGADYARLRHQVEGIFDPQRASRVPVKDRIAAADALGQVRRARAPRTSDEYWRRIEGGTYPIGSSPDKNHPLYDPERFDSYLAPQDVTLESFQIARDPVTVGEFEEFIDDGGYSDPKYWKSGGFGEYGTAPHNWDDQQQNHARPVVSVSWHEALAFCAWAEQTLPTEAQWEAAARGHAARRFPWGNSEPNQERLNFNFQIGHPTPPGIFPTGSTPDGICDLAGNVWEWCLDHAKEPSQARGRTPEPVAAAVSRVSRGGSWIVRARYVRCAVRLRSPAVAQDDSLGFRLVRVQKS